MNRESQIQSALRDCHFCSQHHRPRYERKHYPSEMFTTTIRTVKVASKPKSLETKTRKNRLVSPRSASLGGRRKGPRYRFRLEDVHSGPGRMLRDKETPPRTQRHAFGPRALQRRESTRRQVGDRGEFSRLAVFRFLLLCKGLQRDPHIRDYKKPLVHMRIHRPLSIQLNIAHITTQRLQHTASTRHVNLDLVLPYAASSRL
ncbi:hypothetical protein C8F01DRAFT_88593 [Mycena amicta]|nr:hypothetical protein C8F01DRAFT_88593 [Mycena amicta]